MKRVYISFLLVLFILSCDSKKAIQTNKVDSVVNKTNGTSSNTLNTANKVIEPTTQTEVAIREKVYDPKSFPASDKPMELAQLEKFLPLGVKGMSKLASNTGMQNWDGKLCATVSAEYVYNDGGTIIYIKDYGKLENIPKMDIDDFKKFAEKPTVEFQKVAIPYGKGFMQYLEANRTGILNGLVANRFIIKIDVTNLPKNYYAIYDLLKYIKIDELVKAAGGIKNK